MNARPDKKVLRDSNDGFSVRQHLRLQVLVLLRELLRNARPEYRQLHLSLRELNASRQTAECAQKWPSTWFLRQLAHAERRPEVLPDRERESFRHDSDHGRRCRSEPHDTTYHRRIRAKSPLTDAVPSDCDRARL